MKCEKTDIWLSHFQVYTPNVDENAGPNTLVTTVVASDKDGDGVTFGFVGGTSRSGLFRIEENTVNGTLTFRGRKTVRWSVKLA